MKMGPTLRRQGCQLGSLRLHLCWPKQGARCGCPRATKRHMQQPKVVRHHQGRQCDCTRQCSYRSAPTPATGEPQGMRLSPVCDRAAGLRSPRQVLCCSRPMATDSRMSPLCSLRGSKPLLSCVDGRHRPLTTELLNTFAKQRDAQVEPRGLEATPLSLFTSLTSPSVTRAGSSGQVRTPLAWPCLSWTRGHRLAW